MFKPHSVWCPSWISDHRWMQSDNFSSHGLSGQVSYDGLKSPVESPPD